jgi:hypothetical protein
MSVKIARAECRAPALVLNHHGAALDDHHLVEVGIKAADVLRRARTSAADVRQRFHHRDRSQLPDDDSDFVLLGISREPDVDGEVSVEQISHPVESCGDGLGVGFVDDRHR